MLRFCVIITFSPRQAIRLQGLFHKYQVAHLIFLPICLNAKKNAKRNLIIGKKFSTKHLIKATSYVIKSLKKKYKQVHPPTTEKLALAIRPKLPNPLNL